MVDIKKPNPNQTKPKTQLLHSLMICIKFVAVFIHF